MLKTIKKKHALVIVNYGNKNGEEVFYFAEKIKEIINEGPRSIPPDAEEEKYKARWKQRWLSLLKEDPYFSDLYDEQEKLSDLKNDYFRFEPFVVSSWKGPEPSPVTAEEILKISNEELSKKLKEFKSQNRWDGPSVEGFSTALKEAVKTKPDKFLKDLKPFENARFTYVYEIINGLRDAWNEKKDIQWGALLDFIAIYISQDEFWSDKNIVQEGGDWVAGINHEVVVGAIGELIKDGTRDDAWAFSEEYLEKAKEIIFLLMDKAVADEKDIGSDYVTYSLNSPNGKLIEAFINLTLKIARVRKKEGIEEEPRWFEEFKNKYEVVLKKGITEAYTTVGRFMPNFAYLDMKWLKDQISLLSSEKGSNQWEAFIDGYISIGTVYDDLYELMLPHYEYGLSYDFKERRDWEHLIQHISLGYLRGRETLDAPKSLFKKIVHEWEPERIQEIISFLWMQRNYLTESTDENEKIRTRIIEFWKLIYEKYMDKEDKSLTKKDKNILSHDGSLAVTLSDPKAFEVGGNIANNRRQIF